MRQLGTAGDGRAWCQPEEGSVATAENPVDAVAVPNVMPPKLPGAVVARLLVRLEGSLRCVHVRTRIQILGHIPEVQARNPVINCRISNGEVADQVVELLIACTERVREVPRGEVRAARIAGGVITIRIELIPLSKVRAGRVDVIVHPRKVMDTL